MPHPLVEQLRFARSEFQRCLHGVSEEDAQRRIEPMNCMSWNVGHLAWQEQRYWLLYAGGGELLLTEIDRQFRYGAPASTPSLAEMQAGWKAIAEASDRWLDRVTSDVLLSHVVRNGKPTEFTFGSVLLRTIYHYWYHTGENSAIRQSLGHHGLADFVGDIDHEAPFRV